METFNSIWQETVQQLNESLPQAASYLLPNIVLSKVEGNRITLTLPSKFMLGNISKHKDAIVNTFLEKLGENYIIDFAVDENQKKVSDKEKKSAKESAKKSTPAVVKSKNTTLNKKYTFDNFINGDNSALAYQAAKIIAMNPGTSYNPCLIYGGVGLGKTHLLHSIGNFVDEQNPRKNIIYVTAESFTNEFIASLQTTSSKNQFKQKYRNTDVLLIDDIHFLQKKESTQEELFHIFNELYENNNQIVLTCDRPITELTDITDRLRSRFTRGFNFDLTPPKYEVRMAIAQQKCRDLGFSIPSGTLDYICQAVQTNVRDLEGAINTIGSISTILQKPATIELAKEHIKNIVSEPIITFSYSIDDVFTTTANHFNVSLIDMKGKSRSKNIIIPRQIAIFIASKYGKFTQSDIGKYLGKDHTTIGYTINKTEPLIDMDETLKRAVGDIKNKLEGK